MGKENSEIPDGFIQKLLPEINAPFLMPDTWFYAYQHVPGTYAYFLTAESLQNKGIYTTGLTVNAFPQFAQRTGRSPTSFARELLSQIHLAQDDLYPADDMVILKDRPFTMSKRTFVSLKMKEMVTPSFHGGIVKKRWSPQRFIIWWLEMKIQERRTLHFLKHRQDSGKNIWKQLNS